ncbi:glycine--tRNA ligase subunit beta [Vagococcus elongatus]|uniref:Glycine--tRNA ligase beta subunit n=1 Tax=Vagococcus elongatus TaxID=180344 RepID=A0A430ALR6_9ENTE|nr:glycine--tRNA ligase subunit beta [Vagococcus elongatus]RSU09016.1 glycine--tRNA ligase subunit beta [Vagococcus elongatus]
MTKTYLLEIGLEEMPARVVTSSVNQLKEGMANFLKDNRLSYDTIETYATPRRLALKVINLAEKQTDVEENAKGPAKRIAVDEDGNWTRAAEGFARGQGVSLEELYMKEVKGVEYVYADKFISGEAAEKVLTSALDILKALHFPVTMRWGSFDTEFIRPIHWIVSLLDDQIIPLNFLNVTSGNVSRGHRFLGTDTVIEHSKDYETNLREQFVIADAMERKAMIREQIREIAEKNHWHISLDEKLLEEVNNLVEYPTAFAGNYAEKYLDIPEEALIISMKEHQRYFEVRDRDEKLLPYFIGVRNGNDQYLDNVISGNEKVLVARLEDAVFFYEEDQQVAIEEYVNRLRKVTFHEKIGSIYEKMQRVASIAKLIGEQVKLTEEELKDLERAAAIYKFDLMTSMVGEFPELQGVMGEKYALIKGERPAVAQAIREHYLPSSSEGVLPVSNVGAVLAVADKLDTVTTFFNAGMVPTGSNDPYALRRQTYGIIRIVEDKGWDYPILRLQEEIAEIINDNPDKFGVQLSTDNQKVFDFMKARLKQFLSSDDIRHDVIEAVTNAKQSNLIKMIDAARILKKHQQDSDYKSAMEALGRVTNLAKKGEELLQEDIHIPVDESLFENEEEKELFHAVNQLLTKVKKHEPEDTYLALKDLAPLIEKYFDSTMVMADDEGKRNNRLRQLMLISDLASAFASIDLLTIKNKE